MHTNALRGAVSDTALQSIKRQRTVRIDSEVMQLKGREDIDMRSIIYIIGLVVVIVFVARFLGLG
jgi:hypothetical protein